jgi:hypothetical protein
MSSSTQADSRAARERERWQSAQQHAREHRDRVLSFIQWCALNGISPATGRRILNGDGPKPPVVQLSTRRIGIRESDNAAWQQARRVTHTA